MSLSQTPADSARIAELEAENSRLRLEASRYHGLFAAMDEGFVLLEVIPNDAGQPVDLRHIDANDTFATWVGRARSEVIGLTMRELMPTLAAWWIGVAAQVALTGAPVRFSAHGEVTARDYEIEAWCPRPGQCAALLRDVTEQGRIERALRDSEARFRDVLDNSRDMVYRRNLRTRRYDYISPAAERVLGYTADEVLAMTVDDVVAHVHPDDLAEFHARDAELAESGEERPSNTSVYRWRAKDGEYVWLSASRTLVRDAEGRPLAHVGTVHNVTDLRRARQEREELLRRVEAERATLEAVLEQMPAGVMIAEAPSGRITLANRRMHEVAGWTTLPTSAFEERHHWRGFHPDGRPYGAEDWPLARAILRGELVRDEEIIVVRDDGTRRTISASAAPVRDAGGHVIAGVVIDVDVTGRKQAEAAVESLSRFPSENPMPVLRVARDGSLLFVNAASAPVLALWGCQARGRVPDAWQLLVEEALDSGTGRAVDVATGAATYALYLAPIVDAGYVNIYGADVTAEREATAALRENEARFRELADAMPQLVWTARPDGTVDYYNQRYVEFGGIALTGDHWEWAPAIHPDDVERTAQAWQRAVEAGATYEIEHRARRADGEYRWYLSRGLPVRDAEGRIVRWYGTATDIHDAKRTQEALRESERQLRELNEHLEERVAERTRQLRALAAELSFAEERERRRLADLLHDDLQQTLAAAVYHLDFAREQAPSQAVSAMLSEPMAMLREAIRTSRTLSAELSPALLRDTRLGGMLLNLAQLVEDQHGLRVTVDDREPEDAPPLPDDVRLLLHRCIRELLYNVKKHAGVQEASLTVDRPAPQRVEVTVSDEGQGFDPAEVYARDPRAGGLGLLSIAERLAYIGGKVHIDSASGRGTRIALVVPLTDGTAANAAASALGEAPSAEAVAVDDARGAVDEKSRTRILLVDDHAVVRSALGSLLQGQPDMDVVAEAGDGLEAIELARALRPDVVLMDVGMPGMDGIEATRRLKAEHPRMRVIGLSMYGGEKEGLMRQAGAEAYIPKGGPPDALLAAIRDRAED